MQPIVITPGIVLILKFRRTKVIYRSGNIRPCLPRGQTHDECTNLCVLNKTNHCDDYVLDKASTSVADHQIKSVTGEVVFEEEQHRRHRVRLIPIATIHFLWKGAADQYSVYGQERRVHAPHYPQTCCCGCVIL
ncbi:unnamed protein product [Medioppia subpectinata]|uniref:Uncharacterized protein n=1 Tax=Medioppia subpectinata TaxID=1979941 RepID=A0A7R9KHF9_9ACAR|nr:unnamed protein product [Medioppia subpectinata]CAG2103470.1 unnamed protein product [Medioppia subpectinata]